MADRGKLKTGTILGASIGDCVHVAGVYNFLRLAEHQGYAVEFLGPAVSVEALVSAIEKFNPAMVALSYRLTPAAAENLFRDLRAALDARGLLDRRFVLGGTPPVCRVAEKTDLFEKTFDGLEGDEATIAFLKGGSREAKRGWYPDTLSKRVEAQAPYPIIRHHFGLPSLEETIVGVAELAESRLLDVISIGPDQNAQESFFRAKEMDPAQHGAGGVPVRSPDDFRAIYKASRRGNFPLLRSYSGTRDLVPMARMLKRTINLAWGAVPLMWYNVLDSRSQRPLEAAIREAQETMRWHGANTVPLEVNEAHHWSLRDAHDTVAVAAFFLAAYNAKKAGVREYVAQFMFNTPPGTSFKMDLAKMLAKLELITALEDDGFRIYRQTRTGLASLSADLHVAKGQLASSTMLQMSLQPHIVHVVAHCEADHAATPADIIEAVKIARGAIRNSLYGLPDLSLDGDVQKRKSELIEEAEILLSAIKEIAPRGVKDPWSDPGTLARAVTMGLLDAPHLKGNPSARGALETRMVDGACVAVDGRGKPMTERERIGRLLDEAREGRRPPVAVKSTGSKG